MYIFSEEEKKNGDKCKILCQIYKFLVDEKTYFLGKVTWKSVTCETFLGSLKKIPK